MPIYYQSFVKSFSKHERAMQKRIIRAIEKLPSGDVKKMQGSKKTSKPIFRLRIGKYRVLFAMDEENIHIYEIDSRGDIYK